MSDGLILDETGVQRLVGYTLDISDPGGCARCALVVDERHINRHGVLHGGIADMLLDNASGATASLSVDSSGRTPFLTVSLNTDFLAAGLPGLVTASARITGGGRSLTFIASELRQDDGTLIAMASGVFKRAPALKQSGGGDA